MNNVLDQLELVKQMVSESQGAALSVKNYYILWGLTIPISTIVMFILINNQMGKFIPILWPITCGVSGLLSFLIGIKSKPLHKTVFTKLFSMVWFGIILGNLIAVLFISLKIIPLNISLGIIALLLGVGSIVSGYMQKNIVIKITSIAWYILAIILFISESLTASYIIGISTFFLCFIPGILLRENNE